MPFPRELELSENQSRVNAELLFTDPGFRTDSNSATQYFL